MPNDVKYLAKLRKFYADRRRLPSLGELADLLGFKSKNAARYFAAKWEKAGVLRKDAAGRLVPGRLLSRPLRLLGTVAAGWPSPAEEEMIDTISLDDWLIRNKEASFMLKVSGDSMIDAGIRPGDMVILERGREPKNGDIVVAEIDKEWTIKFYEKNGKAVALRPANRRYKTIFPQEEMRVAGVVTAVIRRY